ncbi:MAG: FIST C-terminal domain-containing protein, partial [Chromatiaceae bacterium]|nr:FIST C-terminal domain-containing protein [Candidatus Thioaporhodococcus sediminis]
VGFPLAHWIGCSTAGEIFGRTLDDDSLVVAIVRFDKARVRSVQERIGQDQGALEAGRNIARALAGPGLKGVFVLADGLAVNGSELAKGLAGELPAGLPVSGGLAADGDRFGNTWVIADKVPQAEHVVAVGFYGDSVDIACNYRGGWDVFGPEREVTRSSGNVLYSLDGQPALALYKKYLGDRAGELPAAGLLFPLAIRNELEADGLTVRTILAINEADQSITFAGDIPQGSFVRMMRANRDRLIDGATGAADGVRHSGGTAGEALCIAISCIGRRLVLGQRCEEEIEAVLDTLPEPCRMIGYYSYGELSPLSSGRCDLHNQTMTLTLIREV